MVGPVIETQYMKSRLPPAARGTVTPLARTSPYGKLIVEVEGSTPLVSEGATDTKPGAVCPTTVTLPVNATEVVGSLEALVAVKTV